MGNNFVNGMIDAHLATLEKVLYTLEEGSGERLEGAYYGAKYMFSVIEMNKREFIKGGFDVTGYAAKCLSLMRLRMDDLVDYDWYEEGRASQSARLEYISERLRLLYVGITRAKRELIITWNSGRDGSLRPAESLSALAGYWEDHLAEIRETNQ